MKLAIQITLYVMALATFVGAFNSKRESVATAFYLALAVFMLYSIGWVTV